MPKLTDIRKMGITYSIVNSEGKLIDTIQIVDASEILEMGPGEYDEALFSGYDEYMKEYVSRFYGFAEEQYRTLWWTYNDCQDGESRRHAVADSVEYAIKYGYDNIVIESIPDIDY